MIPHLLTARAARSKDVGSRAKQDSQLLVRLQSCPHTWHAHASLPSACLCSQKTIIVIGRPSLGLLLPLPPLSMQDIYPYCITCICHVWEAFGARDSAKKPTAWRGPIINSHLVLELDFEPVNFGSRRRVQVRPRNLRYRRYSSPRSHKHISSSNQSFHFGVSRPYEVEYWLLSSFAIVVSWMLLVPS